MTRATPTTSPSRASLGMGELHEHPEKSFPGPRRSCYPSILRSPARRQPFPAGMRLGHPRGAPQKAPPRFTSTSLLSGSPLDVDVHLLPDVGRPAVGLELVDHLQHAG